MEQPLSHYDSLIATRSAGLHLRDRPVVIFLSLLVLVVAILYFLLRGNAYSLGVPHAPILQLPKDCIDSFIENENVLAISEVNLADPQLFTDSLTNCESPEQWVSVSLMVRASFMQSASENALARICASHPRRESLPTVCDQLD